MQRSVTTKRRASPTRLPSPSAAHALQQLLRLPNPRAPLAGGAAVGGRGAPAGPRRGTRLTMTRGTRLEG
eukprot:1037194-Pyramimonas_sp.AAC.1